MWRAVAASTATIVAAASGTATALATGHSWWGLWVALGVFMLVGPILVIVVIIRKHRSESLAATGRDRVKPLLRGVYYGIIGDDVFHADAPGAGAPTEERDPSVPMEGLGGDQSGD